jgi:hypothetical protein
MPGITRRAHNVLTLQVARMNSTLFAVEWKPLLAGGDRSRYAPYSRFIKTINQQVRVTGRVNMTAINR